jgi:hypothetical protein
MDATYQITSEQDEIVIHLPRNLVDEVELARLLDYMQVEAIRRRSQLSEAEASDLGKDVKQGAWRLVKHLFAE